MLKSDMQTAAHVVQLFYESFQRRDYRTMQSLYDDSAHFSDPAFTNLDAREVRAMWEMLISSATDLRIEFSRPKGVGGEITCEWQAWYTFSKTGRPVHNIIVARMIIRDGKIVEHTDSFNFWRWSRQALGIPGLLLGWSSILEKKVRLTARARLDSFMKRSQ
jgi:ketosteroid isomerase-like protein